MNKKIVRHVSEGVDYRGVGGLVKRLVHPTISGSEYLGVSIAYLNPGEELAPHRHNNEEAYFVLQGTGTMTVEDYEEEILLEKNRACLWARIRNTTPRTRAMNRW